MIEEYLPSKDEGLSGDCLGQPQFINNKVIVPDLFQTEFDKYGLLDDENANCPQDSGDPTEESSEISHSKITDGSNPQDMDNLKQPGLQVIQTDSNSTDSLQRLAADLFDPEAEESEAKEVKNLKEKLPICQPSTSEAQTQLHSHPTTHHAGNCDVCFVPEHLVPVFEKDGRKYVEPRKQHTSTNLIKNITLRLELKELFPERLFKDHFPEEGVALCLGNEKFRSFLLQKKKMKRNFLLKVRKSYSYRDRIEGIVHIYDKFIKLMKSNERQTGKMWNGIWIKGKRREKQKISFFQFQDPLPIEFKDELINLRKRFVNIRDLRTKKNPENKN